MRTPCFSLIQGLSGQVPKQEKENRSKNRVCVVVSQAHRSLKRPSELWGTQDKGTFHPSPNPEEPSPLEEMNLQQQNCLVKGLHVDRNTAGH